MYDTRKMIKKRRRPRRKTAEGGDKEK